MIRRQLPDRPIPDEIEPRISHMADGDTVFPRHCKRQHPRHPATGFTFLRQAVDLVVGSGDRLGNISLGFNGIPCDHVHSGLRGRLARGAAAHTIYHQEYPAGLVGIDPVFVFLANQTGIARRSRPVAYGRDHRRVSKERVSTCATPMVAWSGSGSSVPFFNRFPSNQVPLTLLSMM